MPAQVLAPLQANDARSEGEAEWKTQRRQVIKVPGEGQLNKRRATRPADWKPPAGQMEHRLRIGESRWRPLELCWWPEQGKLPVKGKEYPGLGYKRLRDKPPKTQPAATQ
ncbi:hypothetical protein HaLaN_16482 [Haematococcus lacustris]|uniref:Uncharacterized protein n=1 Tax=Haematococcus lacustris TaxID=44745 RepID=A0A699ZCN5_HAELA|nr:hypothetical protein HaLaN_16482 [Haematococcus lacustris]